jgi:hypothetical protein
MFDFEQLAFLNFFIKLQNTINATVMPYVFGMSDGRKARVYV